MSYLLASFVIISTYVTLFYFRYHHILSIMQISQQPDHLLDDADSATKKLGKEKANKGSYLFRSLLSSSARLAFGSDWPVRIFHNFYSYIKHKELKYVITMISGIPSLSFKFIVDSGGQY